MMIDLHMLPATMTFNLTTGLVHLAIAINPLGLAPIVEEAVISGGTQPWTHHLKILSFPPTSASHKTPRKETHCQIEISQCTSRRRLARNWLFK